MKKFISVCIIDYEYELQQTLQKLIDENDGNHDALNLSIPNDSFDESCDGKYDIRSQKIELKYNYKHSSLEILTLLLYINFIFVENEIPEEDSQLVLEDVVQDCWSAIILVGELKKLSYG